MKTFAHSRVGLAVFVAAGMAMNVATAWAHVGPPFPILADQKISGYSASIWADPDIGEALFYLVLEPSEATVPGVSKLEFSVEPINGRLAKKSYSMNQQKARGHLRYLATPHFDTQEFWKVSISVALADGTSHLLEAEVESTPPGLGRWDLVVYLFPFILFGGIWVIRFIRKPRSDSANASQGSIQREIAGTGAKVYQERSK
jgi:hypothetical protein